MKPITVIRWSNWFGGMIVGAAMYATPTPFEIFWNWHIGPFWAWWIANIVGSVIDAMATSLIPALER